MKNIALTPSRPIPREVGGRLCLAFVNSVLWRRGQPRDLLVDYPAFVSYLGAIGCLEGAEQDALLDAARVLTAESTVVFDQLIELREALFRVLSAAAAGEQPAAADVDVLNHVMARGMRSLAVRPSSSGYALTWGSAEHGLDWPVWEIAASAAAVLGSDDLAALKQCPGESCGWLFIDESRGGNRRWCSSRLCGNRDRVRRHYQRTHDLQGAR